MKQYKALTITFLLAFFLSISGQAQEINVGAGMELRRDPSFGMMGKVTYDMGFIDPNLATSLEFMILPRFEGNLDIHYTFPDEKKSTLYGLGGLHFSRNTGLNLGAGFKLPVLEYLSGFAEAKTILKYNPELSIKVGLLYML